jgi:hypothetical protein
MPEIQHIQPLLLEGFAAGECLLPAAEERHLAACPSCSALLAGAARLELALVEMADAGRSRRAHRRRAVGVGIALATASLIVASLLLPGQRLSRRTPTDPFITSPRDHLLGISGESSGVSSLQHVPGVEMPDSPGATPAEETIDRTLPGITGTEGSDT